MAALAFDTHKAVMALKQAGFEEGQAEAVVNTMGRPWAATSLLRPTSPRSAPPWRRTSRAVRAEMAQAFQALYKQLWLMAVGIVGLTVTPGQTHPVAAGTVSVNPSPHGTYPMQHRCPRRVSAAPLVLAAATPLQAFSHGLGAGQYGYSLSPCPIWNRRGRRPASLRA